jgi:hypothetical protein
MLTRAICTDNMPLVRNTLQLVCAHPMWCRACNCSQSKKGSTHPLHHQAPFQPLRARRASGTMVLLDQHTPQPVEMYGTRQSNRERKREQRERESESVSERGRMREAKA